MTQVEFPSLRDLLLGRWSEFAADVEQLVGRSSVPLGQAKPPNCAGVYLLRDDQNAIAYVGKAVGKEGLRDRFPRKHISGDDSHAIQRAYLRTIAERNERRLFIKKYVSTSWLEVSDHRRAADLERLMIWLLQPPWNRQ